MNTYYTLEEKYLQATDKLDYGKTPKALQLLNEIISNDPFYAKAHYQLGKIYYYDLEDHQTAGYHFKTCMELDPTFPANYFHYLSLVVFLNMGQQVNHIASKALTVPGVQAADIYNLVGICAEQNKQWEKALNAYNEAFDVATYKSQREKIEDSIERVKAKIQRSKAYQYTLTE